MVLHFKESFSSPDAADKNIKNERRIREEAKSIKLSELGTWN